METRKSSMQSLRPAYECYARGEKLYDQKAWTHVEKRMPTAVEYPTPGPNAMPLPFYIGKQVLNSAIIHRPAWSLHRRIQNKLSHYPAGPTSYDIRDLKANGGKVSTPAYTLRIKPHIRLLQELPGPASYEAKFRSILPNPPAFTFRVKPLKSATLQTPAPNEYTTPNMLGHHKTPPAHIIGHRLHLKASIFTPGPGAYSHEHFLKMLPRSPIFSIREKIKLKVKTDTPGPGSYCPEKVIVNQPVAPRHTMGIKHSPYKGIWNPRIIGPRFC